MARKKPSSAQLGSFEELEARAIVDSLMRLESIKATVHQLMVGADNDQPTDWWIVEVPDRSALSANTWLRGWKAGQVHKQIERHREFLDRLSTGELVSYADAAHRLGYLEIMPEEPTIDPNAPRATCDESHESH